MDLKVFTTICNSFYTRCRNLSIQLTVSLIGLKHSRARIVTTRNNFWFIKNKSCSAWSMFPDGKETVNTGKRLNFSTSSCQVDYSNCYLARYGYEGTKLPLLPSAIHHRWFTAKKKWSTASRPAFTSGYFHYNLFRSNNAKIFPCTAGTGQMALVAGILKRTTDPYSARHEWTICILADRFILIANSRATSSTESIQALQLGLFLVFGRIVWILTTSAFQFSGFV